MFIKLMNSDDPGRNSYTLMDVREVTFRRDGAQSFADITNWDGSQHSKPIVSSTFVLNEDGDTIDKFIVNGRGREAG